MKTLITTALSLLILLGINTNSTAQLNITTGSKLQLEKSTHDFGTVEQNAPTEVKIKVSNPGDEPLVLTDVKGSCQCTVPVWPKEPIAPGSSAFITIKYNSSRIGPINKSVTVRSNSAEEAVKVIRIKGEVVAKK